MEKQDREDLNRVIRNLAGLVRVGRVMAVDNDKRIARVMFKDPDFNSDWLPVLDNRDYIPGYGVDQRTEFEEGGSGDPAFEKHKHDLVIKPFMPKVNEQVLCIYTPLNDISRSDGFILGRIWPWR